MIKQFAYSISQSADADSSLYQREPCYLFDLKCWFAIKQVYQREPCCSFGLKCWFTVKQFYQKQPILWFIWLTILHRFTDSQSTLPVFAKRSHHPPLPKEGRFAVCLSWYFIAENMIKQFAYSISQSAALTALFTKERADYNNKCNSKKNRFHIDQGVK